MNTPTTIRRTIDLSAMWIASVAPLMIAVQGPASTSVQPNRGSCSLVPCVPEETAMSDRVEVLAQRFVAGNDAFSAFIAAIPAAQWDQVVGAGELRTVGLVAQHVAFSYGFLARYFGAIADRQPLPALSPAEANAVNARVAEEAAGMTQAAVLAALRSAATTATAWIRGLSVAQLAQQGEYVVGVGTLSVERWIASGYVRHPQAHLQDIRTALGG